jgi:hypothetical protein
MSPGSNHEQHGISAGCNVQRDLFEMQDPGVGVAEGKDETRRPFDRLGTGLPICGQFAPEM